MITFDDEICFSYESSGNFVTDDEWIHPIRKIDSFELILMLEGEAFIFEGKNEYRISKNDMLILSPNTEHGGYKPSFGDTSFFWLHFKTNEAIPFKYLKNADTHEIIKLLKRLLHITNMPEYSKKTADSLAYLIFEELNLIGRENPIHQVKIAEIIEYIRINSHKPLTVKKLANHFNYNSDYIGKIFRQELDMGCKEYIIEQRLKLVENLLMTTKLSIKEIAARLSFPDENGFIKFFSYHRKMSPGEYRKQYYNTHLNNK